MGEQVGAQRTPYENSDIFEMRRQAERVREQYDKLENLLKGTIEQNLNNINTIIGNRNKSITSQIDELIYAITDYLPKANEHYSNLANALEKYASGTESNVQELSQKITDVKGMVDNL